MKKICDAMGIRLHHPRDFLARQKVMELGDVARGKSEVGFGRTIDLDTEESK